MIRIFLFLLLVLFLGLGFAWFADRPGDVTLEWQGNQYQTSLMVVLVGLVALVAAIMITWWLARTILDSPQIVQRFFKARRKDRGYTALSKGLIAANSGDASSARRYTKESVKLLGREPLVDLLDAQSALLEGKREDARARFEAMLEDDETRLVALRGLYLEAERQGAKDAARHYAETAHDEAPALPWAGNAKLRYACMDGDWEGAIAALDANKSAGLIDKETAKRQRAVLLTALAMAEEPADPTRAARHAKEAYKLAPDLVPAAVIGAKALTRNNDIGRAAGMIETVWKKQPHPDLAHSYVHLRMGDSATDRLKRARKIAALKANHVEGNFAIAEAAIDAQDWKLARETLKSVLSTQPSERACLLMAEVEEGQFGDKGRMREWLSRAVRAPKDAAWTADGYVSDKWLPISPLSGRIDAFEWKVPVEQLTAPEAATLDADGLEDLIREPETAPVSEERDAASDSGQTGASDERENRAGAAAAAAALSVAADEGKRGETPADTSPSSERTETEEGGKVDTSRQAGQSEPDAAKGDSQEAASDHTVSPDDVIKPEDGELSTSGAEKKDPSTSGSKQEVDGETHAGSSDSDTQDHSQEEKLIEAEEVSGEAASKARFILDRRPDDPGIDEEAEPEKPKRFGIF